MSTHLKSPILPIVISLLGGLPNLYTYFFLEERIPALIFGVLCSALAVYLLVESYWPIVKEWIRLWKQDRLIKELTDREGFLDLHRFVSQSWGKSISGYYIAPAGLHWIKEGSILQVGYKTRIKTTCKIGNRCIFWRFVKIEDNVDIDDDVVLKDGVELKSYVVIKDDTRIDSNSIVENGAYIYHDCRIGTGSFIGHNCIIDQSVQLPRRTYLPSNTDLKRDIRYAVSLGFTDGYNKVLCQDKDGAYFISAGCRYLTIEKALAHWSNHREDRRATMAQLSFAQELIKLREEKVQT